MRPTSGTYFQLADYTELTQMPDTEFVTLLTQKAGVAAIPISVFCKEPLPANLVRFCFAKDDATLQAAAEKLKRTGDYL
ncbi:MAG: methionine aminotransferase, partial [Gammaproteobacteria bacterium]|nr:methionine aminotransferase [Gammaproteobacteria bacterium]